MLYSSGGILSYIGLLGAGILSGGILSGYLSVIIGQLFSSDASVKLRSDNLFNKRILYILLFLTGCLVFISNVAILCL